jgi:uncharacterized membrane protein
MNVSLYSMVVVYVFAGVYHFVNPRFYLSMMPQFIPYHSQLVAISGVMEILFALMLIPETTRVIAAWLIIALLVGVFPANIQMSVNFYKKKNRFFWFTIARLPLQILFIWWALQFTHL